MIDASFTPTQPMKKTAVGEATA